jgi:hypothetical protein
MGDEAGFMFGFDDIVRFSCVESLPLTLTLSLKERGD